MSDDKKLLEPRFTEIQNRLTELHDELFPGAKDISANDEDFIRRHNRATGQKFGTAALQARLAEARKELELARERLGPAGWKMLEELELLRRVAAAAQGVMAEPIYRSDSNGLHNKLYAALREWEAGRKNG